MFVYLIFFFFLGRLLVELFPSIFTQREGERKKNVTDSAKRHRESSELFKPAADLGTARYTPIRGRRRRPSSPTPPALPPATHSLTRLLPFRREMETAPKVPIKISVCDAVCAEREERREGGRTGGRGKAEEENRSSLFLLDGAGENKTKAARSRPTGPQRCWRVFLSTPN